MGILLIVVLYRFPTVQTLGNSFLGKGETAKAAIVKNDIQEISIDLKSRAYAPIVVQKGIPVKFNIIATQDNINSCNGTIIIPELNIEKTLVPGDNIIEFTPENEGTIAYSCWMGMINSKIQVVADLDAVDVLTLPAQGNAGAFPSCCNPPQ